MIMKKLIKKIDTKCENILVIGDGRAEVLAGVQMGALVISRLPKEAKYQRELHKKLGTNIIISNYDDDRLYEVLSNAYR